MQQRLVTTLDQTGQQLHGVFTQAYRTILAGETELPSLPRVAARLSQILQDRNYTLEQVVPVVQSDAAAAAYLLRAANSALYRRRIPVTDLQTAINRFGATTTRNLLMSYSMRSVFGATTSLFGRLLESTWQNSIRVAAMAAVIAKRLLPRATDEALLAGLLHDIGALPLLQQFQKRGLGEADTARIVEALDRYAPTVGVALLEHWHFEQAFKDTVRHARDWNQSTPGPLNLSDIVLLARLHGLIATGQAANLPRLIDLPVFRKLPQQALSPKLSLAVIEEAQDDIQDVIDLLGH